MPSPPDPFDPTALLDLFARVDALRERQGVTERSLSMQVTGKPDFIRDLRRKGHLPKGENLERLASTLGSTTDYLLGRAATPDQVRSEVRLADRAVDWRGPIPGEPGLPLVGTGDCADLEVCDETGELVGVERNSFDPDYTVRLLARPPALRGAPDAFAIVFQGDSMWPRFEPGEIGIVEPRRPVARGDYVLVQLTNGEHDDVVSVLVKRLVRQTATELVLQQFNPARTFILPRSRVARMHPIRRQNDYLF